MNAVRLPPHRHCLRCDEPIAEEDTFCSQECELEFKTKSKRSNRKMIYLYAGAMAVLVILWVVSIFVHF